jgi:hypothetical protein
VSHPIVNLQRGGITVSDNRVPRFRVHKRCVIFASQVTYIYGFDPDNFQGFREKASRGDQIQQLLLAEHPVYETWVPQIDEDGDVKWKWDGSMPSTDRGPAPRLIVRGGADVSHVPTRWNRLSTG